MQTRNLKHNKNGGVDMEINHAVYGWIPYAASATDTEQGGRDLYAGAIAGGLGTVAAYLPTAAEIKAATNEPILAQIADVEARQGRALREAALGQTGAAARLAVLDAQVVVLRAQLVP